MNEGRNVSVAVVRRLPRYLRLLDDLMSAGLQRTSSGQLGQALGLTASQIRQDLNCFGGFGQQGYGYNVAQLRGQIAAILGLDRGRTAILVGAGNLGRALCRNFDFVHAGFSLLAAFDIAPERVGSLPENLPLFSTDELDAFVFEKKPDIAVLTLTREHAADMAARLAGLGVKALWNFTGADISQEGVILESVHFSDSLMTLSYYVGAESKAVE